MATLNRGRTILMVAAVLLCALVSMAAPGRSGIAWAAGSAVTSETEAPDLVLTDDDNAYLVAPHLEVLVDESTKMTIADVLKPAAQAQFKPVGSAGPWRGAPAFWLRLHVADHASAGSHWLLVYDNYRVNQIWVYTPTRSGYRVVKTGNEYPFSSRDIPDRLYVFRLNPSLNMTDTVYVRLQDLSGFVPLTPLSIESAEGFIETAQQDYFWAGVFYFVVLTVLFFNLLFIFSLRERAVPSFALFLLAVLFVSLSADGLGHQFLWPSWPGWAQASMLTAALVFVVALLAFTNVVFDLRKNLPRWSRASVAIIIALLVAGLLERLPGTGGSLTISVLLVLMLAGIVLPIAIAVRMLPKQRGPALLFLVGFGAYLVTLVLAIVRAAQSGPDELTPWTRVAFVWLLLVFSLVINMRVRAVREEKDAAREQLISEQEEAIRIQTELAEALETSRDNILAAYDTTLEGWARLLESRDKETEGHSRNVTDLTVAFAEALGMHAEDIVALRRGALLHDIGKISVPDAILLKPGPLTDEEWEVMKQHPLYAQQALQEIPFLERALDIPVYHHERWDGSGYPYALAGTRIPYSARIFAIVDNWDALLSDRPYRKAWPAEKVIAYLEENAGVLFDPEMVPVFVRMVAATPDGPDQGPA